jgi:hypothetical protein
MGFLLRVETIGTPLVSRERVGHPVDHLRSPNSHPCWTLRQIGRLMRLLNLVVQRTSPEELTDFLGLSTLLNAD